jgi:hypothetical protein
LPRKASASPSSNGRWLLELPIHSPAYCAECN